MAPRAGPSKVLPSEPIVKIERSEVGVASGSGQASSSTGPRKRASDVAELSSGDDAELTPEESAMYEILKVSLCLSLLWSSLRLRANADGIS